jgi:hypothetical protein
MEYTGMTIAARRIRNGFDDAENAAFSTVFGHLSGKNPAQQTTAMTAPAGGVYVAPAGQGHTLWARDSEVRDQEAGDGPAGTTMVN